LTYLRVGEDRQGAIEMEETEATATSERQRLCYDDTRRLDDVWRD